MLKSSALVSGAMEEAFISEGAKQEKLSPKLTNEKVIRTFGQSQLSVSATVATTVH